MEIPQTRICYKSSIAKPGIICPFGRVACELELSSSKSQSNGLSIAFL